jgi:coenzyme PQQ precursor peptide PqqA
MLCARSLAPPVKTRRIGMTYGQGPRTTLALRTPLPSGRGFDYSYVTASAKWLEPEMGEIMEWTAPAFEEVCLNCEINSYVSAKL